ncbi:MAG: TraR/DksA family transcriptional regulator [Enhygromyxa sp.]
MSLSPEQIAEFRALLEQQREELLGTQELAVSSTKPVELDQTTVGRLSRMEAIQAQAMAVATQNRREVQLQRIKAALTRIDEGEYGLCVDCDEPINPRRLAFNPTAPLCLTCAQRHEDR